MRYTSQDMHRMNTFFMLAFTFVALCGNVCLLGTAEAKTHRENGPRMSLNIPEKCPWINKSVGPIDTQHASPCATGDCFREPEPETVDRASALTLLSIMSIMPSSPIEEDMLLFLTTHPLTLPTNSPSVLSEFVTVVLRC